MICMQEPAYGKLNLTLDVLGQRPDGYHEMEMVMQTVSCCDQLTVAVETGGDWFVQTTRAELPNGPDNLAWKAAQAFESALGRQLGGVQVTIQKQIPSQAGMAGGSSDAAAVLRALNTLCGKPFSLPELAAIGAQVGSDVPFCVVGGTQLAQGRGERLTALPPLPACWFVLCKPSFSISTPAFFREIDRTPIAHHPDTAAMCAALHAQDLHAIGSALCNVFEPVAAVQFPVVEEIVQALCANGALGAALTGTGSVVFGLFDTQAQARAAMEALPAVAGTAMLAQPVPSFDTPFTSA